MKRATTLREGQKQLEKEAGPREKSKIYVINPVNNTKLPYLLQWLCNSLASTIFNAIWLFVFIM